MYLLTYLIIACWYNSADSFRSYLANVSIFVFALFQYQCSILEKYIVFFLCCVFTIFCNIFLRSLLARTQSLPRDASTNTPIFNISPPSPTYDIEEDFYSPGARHGYVTFDLDALGRKTTPVWLNFKWKVMKNK